MSETVSSVRKWHSTSCWLYFAVALPVVNILMYVVNLATCVQEKYIPRPTARTVQQKWVPGQSLVSVALSVSSIIDSHIIDQPDSAFSGAYAR